WYSSAQVLTQSTTLCQAWTPADWSIHRISWLDARRCQARLDGVLPLQPSRSLRLERACLCRGLVDVVRARGLPAGRAPPAGAEGKGGRRRAATPRRAAHAPRCAASAAP